ncbi:MAG: hypothetical protein OXI12_16370, partial [Gammaproteobacteria bacterium]|nr:hypothetical protein [Gammaproteobacteria bacterium]
SVRPSRRGRVPSPPVHHVHLAHEHAIATVARTPQRARTPVLVETVVEVPASTAASTGPSAASGVGTTQGRCGISAVPHGFRSSFRDWAAEKTDHPREVVEAALEASAHGGLGRVPRGLRRSHEARRLFPADSRAFRVIYGPQDGL